MRFEVFLYIGVNVLFHADHVHLFGFNLYDGLVVQCQCDLSSAGFALSNLRPRDFFSMVLCSLQIDPRDAVRRELNFIVFVLEDLYELTEVPQRIA